MNDLLEPTKNTLAGLLPSHAREEVAKAIIAGHDHPSLSKERSLALMAIDADGIQKMLLASPRPVTAYGASRLLAEWDEDLHALPSTQEARATVLFAGGGNGTLLLPASLADAYVNALEQEFAERVYGNATCAYTLVSPYELVHGPNALNAASSQKALDALGISASAEKDQGFGACLRNLQFALQQKKYAHKQALFTSPPKPPYCIECRAQSQKSGPLCGACSARRIKGSKVKEEMNQAQSFDKLYEQSSYIAYIYLDGRGIGNLLFKINTIKAYREFSQALHKAFFLPEAAKNEYLCILSGGDDLLLVVPATGPNDAFHFTIDLIESIEKKLDKYKCGVGAGIVIAKTEPADFCMERAFLLCKNAKTEPNTQEARSAVDFEILLDGSPISDSITETRAKDKLDISPPSPIPKMESLWMTQRPYTLPRFRQLLTQAQNLQKVPRSQLFLLNRELRSDIYTGLISTLYQAARHPGLKEALGIKSLSERFDHLSEWLLHKKLHAPQGQWETALPDLIELSGLLRKGNDL